MFIIKKAIMMIQMMKKMDISTLQLYTGPTFSPFESIALYSSLGGRGGRKGKGAGRKKKKRKKLSLKCQKRVKYADSEDRFHKWPPVYYYLSLSTANMYKHTKQKHTTQSPTQSLVIFVVVFGCFKIIKTMTSLVFGFCFST